MVKTLIWSPRDPHRFIVGGGSQITLYEWASEFPEIRHVTSQLDLQYMKCFAWSPDAAFDDLIAVGHTTGRVDLMRLEASKHARHPKVLSSGPMAALPVRNSRSCNALAFCNADPNYLAVGLDKVRGDSSLIIWDIATTLPSLQLNLSPSASTTAVTPRPQPHIARGDIGPRVDSRILQQHAPTEIVSSLAFLPRSTHILLAGVSNRWLRLFDLRNPAPSALHVASKVQGMATDPFEPNRVACFGDGTITLWDTRKFVYPLLTFTEKDAGADKLLEPSSSAYINIEFSKSRRGVLATLERESSYVRMWDLMSTQNPTKRNASVDKTDGSSVASSQPHARLSNWNLPWTNALQPSPKEQEPSASVVLCDTKRTKQFPHHLASFALVPNSTQQAKPLTSQIMVVNKNGDLQLYAIHDTPKPTLWSSRGDLVIGAGESFKVLSASLDEEDIGREPWDIQGPPSQHRPPSKDSRSRSAPDTAEEPLRGRGRARGFPADPIPLPLFGRGDEEGFPALGKPSNLAVGKPGQTRHYSPASLRQYGQKDRSLSTGRFAQAPKPTRSAPLMSPPQGRKHAASRDSSVSKHFKAVSNVVADDISMIMRRRALRGYGISDPYLNVAILRSELIEEPDDTTQLVAELWVWINNSREYLCRPTARIHGYDFSYEGVLGIWEGLTAAPDTFGNRSPVDDLRGDFQASLTELLTRRRANRYPWIPNVRTSKLLQRQVCLELCGWSVREDDLMKDIQRWEREGKYSRAACWLVFTKQSSKAIDLLLRSEDERHHMMSGTLAALVSTSSSRTNAELQRLIVKLEDPYFRAMLTHLAVGDWTEILEEETLPFYERLAIAFQFLEDKPITSFLRRWLDNARVMGTVDALMLTGLNKLGFDIVQKYIDRTGDVQTASILAAYVTPWKFQYRRCQQWMETYRDILDGFKMHHYRVAFDIEYGHILKSAVDSGDMPETEWVPAQIMIRCHYCNKSVNQPASTQTRGRPTCCPHCNRSLPRCSVCTMTLSIIQDDIREAELATSQYKDTIDDSIVICQTCRHGGHASHILEWFFGGEEGVGAHDLCPVADCNCHCAKDY